MKKILILGATSAIAEATARIWARSGSRLYLIGRNEARLGIIADDLAIRGAESVSYAVLDLNELDKLESAINEAIRIMNGMDVALIAHGVLGRQSLSEKSVSRTVAEWNTNAVSVIGLLTVLANRFEAQRGGTIAVLGSVAGDRGRQSNYVYGSAKGAVAVFLQGLRNRLHKSDVSVVTIKLGPVDTPMTADVTKTPLWVSTDTAARSIVQAIQRRRNVIYVPFFWRFIMFIVKLIPEGLFKRSTF